MDWMDWIAKVDVTSFAEWASIISLLITFVSLFLIRSIRRNIIASRGKARLRQLFAEISTIPEDAVPFSSATKSKFSSLNRNLSTGFYFWSKKSIAVREIRAAIKSEDMPAILEGIEDYKSLCEDL